MGIPSWEGIQTFWRRSCRWLHYSALESRRRHRAYVSLCPPQEQRYRIFIPDPQFLGYINPRIGGRGEDITSDYQDAAEYVKLFLPEGEIDFVASSTLTNNPFEEHEVLGRNILLETPIEIVAKKIWHRGDRATPRDLLDLAMVIDHHYAEILNHRDIFLKHIEAFTHQCESRKSIMLPVFDAIEKIDCNLSFDECLQRANVLKADLLKKA